MAVDVPCLCNAAPCDDLHAASLAKHILPPETPERVLRQLQLAHLLYCTISSYGNARTNTAKKAAVQVAVKKEPAKKAAPAKKAPAKKAATKAATKA